MSQITTNTNCWMFHFFNTCNKSKSPRRYVEVHIDDVPEQIRHKNNKYTRNSWKWGSLSHLHKHTHIHKHTWWFLLVAHVRLTMESDVGDDDGSVLVGGGGRMVLVLTLAMCYRPFEFWLWLSGLHLPYGVDADAECLRSQDARDKAAESFIWICTFLYFSGMICSVQLSQADGLSHFYRNANNKSDNALLSNSDIYCFYIVDRLHTFTS